MSDIGIIVVTWNSGDTIGRCLSSCGNLPVTVVDNASSDDTVDVVRAYPGVCLISNRENRGFAAAVNQAAARSDASYILLVNPDVELMGPVDSLVKACERGAVASAGRLAGRDGETQRGFTIRRLPSALTLMFEVLGLNRLWPRNPVNRRYRCLDMDLNSEADVEQPAGALLLFPRRVWLELGGFDSRFFPVWFEDVDFCARALKLGTIRYVPQVAARHAGGSSISRLDWTCREMYWYVSLLKYASKHFAPYKFRGVSGAVVLGSAVRLLMAALTGRKLSQAIKVYGTIAGFALRCIVRGRVPEPVSVEGFQESSRIRTISSAE